MQRPGQPGINGRPHIVLITLDSWRYDALGRAPSHRTLERYGVRADLHTPNLDKVAQESVYFAQALACAPHTTVSHASLMTGLFPPQHGVHSFFYERLPAHVETLAEALKATGYETITLRETGLPTYSGILQANDVLRGFDTTATTLGELRLAAQQAHQRGRPVFAFLHLWDLHAPYQYSLRAQAAGSLQALARTADALAERWGIDPPSALTESELMRFRQRLAQAIPAVDERIRTLFAWYVDGVSWFDREQWPLVEDTLRAAGLWDDAVVFMYGDHGECAHPDGHGADVVGHGWTLLDEVLRVPLLVRGLSGAAPRVVRRQVSLADIAPTIADVAGVDLNTHFALWRGAPYRGQSLLSLAHGAEDGDSRIHFAEVWRGARAAPAGQPMPQQPYLRSVRTEGHKLVRHDGAVSLRCYRAQLSPLERIRERAARWSGEPRTATRLFWTDLCADPDELQPVHVRQNPPPPIDALHLALQRVYAGETVGPAIELPGRAEEEAVLERLRALGYIEN